MKKLTLIAIFIGSLLFSTANHAKAQNQQGEITVNAGAGYSLIFAIIDPLVKASITSGNVTSNAPPVFNGTVDYAFNSWFSLGIGIGYQSITVNINNFTDSNNTPYLYNQNASASVSRLNIGLRPCFHLGKNPNVDPYFGLKVGVSIWSFALTSTDPNYNLPLPYSGTVPAFQAFFGLKGYFLPFMGAHFEIAVGSPYFIEAGLNFRFGNTGLDAKKS